MEITNHEGPAPFIADTPEKRAIIVLIEQRDIAKATVERQRTELAKINRLYLQRTKEMTIWEGVKNLMKIIFKKK
jgi:hypothetical protein